MRKITIKDVAKEAGVAISTVSNALNNSNLVNDDTKARIIKIAEQMNYIPNMNGKYLKSDKTNTLGFISSSIRGQYFYILLDAMCSECEKFGYVINFINTRDKNVIMNNILGKSFDGIFIYEGERIGQKELDIIEQNHIRTILFDRNYNSKFVSSVIFDSYKAGYEITKYLINLGHKRIFFLEGAPDVYDSNERKRGYMAAMKEHGIKFSEDYVAKGMFEEVFTYNTVTYLLDVQKIDVPDAFIAGNDLSAVGCMKALHDIGYRVPEDVSVVGFDDIEIAQYFTPTLTTIRNPIHRQGIVAVNLMMKMINDGHKGISEQLHGKLIPRNSSGICSNVKYNL